jgi:hypothetical protein
VEKFRSASYKGTRPGLAGVYNRLVRFVDNGPYSHGELVFSDGMSASASWMDDGVRFKQINFNPALWDFIDLPPEKEAAARQWFIDHEGEPYDLPGNLRFFCGIIREADRGWFCSEAKAAALGLTEPWRYGPNGLVNILRELYPGG